MKLLSTLAVCALMLGVSVVMSHPAAVAAPKVSPHSPSITFAAADPIAACKKDFLGLSPWYNYMDQEFTPDGASKCGYRIKCFNIFTQNTPNDCGQTKSDLPGVLLAIIDDLLRIAGLVAVAFVFVGAFQYVESRGNSEKTASAQSTIINALVGLVVSMVAVGLIAFLGHRLGG